MICLFLGGGTPSAVFNWSLSFLPGDFSLGGWKERARGYIGAHVWLSILLICLGVVLILGILFLRVAFRFVLVDAIFTRDVHVRRAWRKTRHLSRSYWRWLLLALAVVTLGIVGGALATYPYLRSAAAAGIHSAVFWVTLITVLAVDIFLGLGLAILIVLTDDLAVPIMYAEGRTLDAAWGQLWKHLRAEPASFGIYLLLRFAVAILASVAILLCLFPVLLGLFSGAIIMSALVVVATHLFGIVWSWNAFTISFVAAGLAVLLTSVLTLLSVVGMPIQVFIQDFGIRFIAPRVPAMESLLQAGPAGWE